MLLTWLLIYRISKTIWSSYLHLGLCLFSTPFEARFFLSVTSKCARAITQGCVGDMFCEDMLVRVGKTGSLGPWCRVIRYCRSRRMLTVIPLGISCSHSYTSAIWQYDSAPRPQRSCFAHPNIDPKGQASWDIIHILTWTFGQIFVQAKKLKALFYIFIWNKASLKFWQNICPKTPRQYLISRNLTFSTKNWGLPETV